MPVVPEEVPTLSAVEPVRLPTVAVTVIDVPFATPEAVIVVVALPVVPVTAFALARAPGAVVKVTETPDSATPSEFLTTALIVAGAVPSPGTVPLLDVTDTDEGVVFVVVPVPPVLAPVR